MDLKNLHIITYNGEYSNNIIDYFNSNFNQEEQYFLLLDYPQNILDRLMLKKNYYYNLRTEYLSIKKLVEIKYLFQKAENIIWHGIFLRTKWLLCLYFVRKYDKKFIWISQGSDLYNFESNIENFIKKRIHNYFEFNFRQRISHFCGITENDIMFWEKYINNHGRPYLVNYLDINKKIFIKENIDKINDEKIKIMVGINFSPLNNHMKILYNLRKFRYKNIKIYIALEVIDENESIKFKKYITDVKEYAKLMFGDKAIIVEGKMFDNHYFRLLDNIDIIITCINSNLVHIHYIYEGILYALYLGKKVYLDPKMPLYTVLKRNNACVDSFIKLYRKNFSDFKLECLKEINNKSKTLDFHYDSIKLWTNLFESVRNENKKIKFLHIIRPNIELASPIISLIEKNYKSCEHRFLINRRVPFKLYSEFFKFNNVDLFLIGNTRIQRILYLYKRLSHAEHIIWHGLYAGYGNSIFSVKELIFLTFFHKILYKVAWVGWGIDLYNWKCNFDKANCILKYKIKFLNFLSEYLRKSIDYYISIFLPDGESFKSQFGRNKIIFDGTYANPQFSEILELTRPKLSNKKNKPIRIMVGHSGNKWNNHKKILNMLTQFRYENIRIYLVISTGVDNLYKKNVEVYSKKLFGKKAIPIKSKMPLEKYIQFLWKMDIAIFDFKQQAALGNIMNLLYMGKKIFLPSDNIMYAFLKKQGVYIFDTNSIANLDFENFVDMSQIKEKPKYILQRTDPVKNLKKWDYIFKMLERGKNK